MKKLWKGFLKLLGIAPNKEPRKFFVATEDLEEFLALTDAYHRDSSGINRARLWKWVEAKFPATSDGHWVININNALHPYVYEVLD